MSDAIKWPRVSAAWLQSPAISKVFAAIAKGGAEARVVGGAVRNALIDWPVKEVDIATTALPDDVMRLARDAGLGAHPTGIDHGTVTVVADKQPFEVTTLRRDVETDGRHAVVTFTTSWDEDAARRDFTINALYCSSDGTLYDPVGGLDDLRKRRVRFIGSPQARIREDFLRILRFFRFQRRVRQRPSRSRGPRRGERAEGRSIAPFRRACPHRDIEASRSTRRGQCSQASCTRAAFYS